MKRLLIIIAIVIIAKNVNAQWFLGGEIGLNVRQTTNNYGMGSYHTRTDVGFVIAPKGGYYFNEKFAVGLGVHVGPSFEIEENQAQPHAPILGTRGYSINWGIYPFVRFAVFSYKKFSIILEGNSGFGAVHRKSSGSITELTHTFRIGVFNVTPILGFNLTEHFQLEAGLHFFNLGYNIGISHTPMTNSGGSNSITHDFGFGFNSSNILRMSQLTIGVIYKF